MVANNDLNRDLLNLEIIADKRSEKEVESDEEENALPEVNDVSVLASSKLSIKATERKHHLPYKGFLLASLSAVLFALSAMFTKLAKSLTASDIACIRYIIQLIIGFIMIKYKGFHLLGPKEQRTLLVFRGIIGTLSLVTFLFAFKLIDPSDCITVLHTSIIITAVLARFFLSEKLSITHIIALFLTAAGIFLIAKPKSLFKISDQQNFTSLQNSTTSSNFTTNQSPVYTAIGIILSLICALCSSSVQIMLKKLSSQKVHYSILIIYVTYVGVPVTFLMSLILVLAGFSHQNFLENIHLLPMGLLHASIAGLLGTIAQTLLNMSLKYEDASKVSIVRSLEVLVAFILQYFILNISVDIFSIMGSLAIIVGTLLILSFKIIENRMEQKNQAKKGNKNLCSKCVSFKF